MLPIFHGDARVMDLASDQFGREGSGISGDSYIVIEEAEDVGHDSSFFSSSEIEGAQANVSWRSAFKDGLYLHSSVVVFRKSLVREFEAEGTDEDHAE